MAVRRLEDSKAIDPRVFRDPTNGSLWLRYGSYFGQKRRHSTLGQIVLKNTNAQEIDQGTTD